MDRIGNSMDHDGHVPTAGELLAFGTQEPDCFRARFSIDNHMNAVFGGQLLGQALAAASATAGDWPANSLNGYFFRGGKLDQPLDYRVERISDGRRFATRRVTAEQGGRAIFGMQCSFHAPERGVEHGLEQPPAGLPEPENLANLQQIAEGLGDALPDFLRQSLRRPFPIELCPTQPDRFLNEADRIFWFRMPTAVEVADDAGHQALLAMMSDYWLPGSITPRHNRGDLRHVVLSLNHSLWFHQPARVDEWLLFVTGSDWAGHGRGLAQGRIFRRDAVLVATVTQEALVQLI